MIIYLHRYNMVARAKRCMANQAEPTEVDRRLIEFLEEVMRMKVENGNMDSDREECTREDLKAEPISDDEQQNYDEQEEEENHQSATTDDYVSLKDIEVSIFSN